jgi:signal peptidase I
MKSSQELFDLEVRGTSMEPYLKNGQVVKMRKKDSKYLIQRGDIVLFTRDRGKSYQIKRIVGLPSEQVGFILGNVYIKKQSIISWLKKIQLLLPKFTSKTQLAEPYLASHVRTWKLGIKNFQEKNKQSDDLWEPQLKENEYYILGDNRTSSRDSRKFGPIQYDQIRYIIVDK